MRHSDWMVADNKRRNARQLFDNFFQDWDILLTPVCASAAFPHNHNGQRYERRTYHKWRATARNAAIVLVWVFGGCWPAKRGWPNGFCWALTSRVSSNCGSRQRSHRPCFRKLRRKSNLQLYSSTDLKQSRHLGLQTTYGYFIAGFNIVSRKLLWLLFCVRIVSITIEQK